MPFPDITQVSKPGGRMLGTGLPLWASSALGFVGWALSKMDSAAANHGKGLALALVNDPCHPIALLDHGFEPAFHPADSGSVSWSIMQLEPWPAGEPDLCLTVLNRYGQSNGR